MKRQDRPFVTSISYPKSKEEVLDELKIIAVREKKSQSELIIELIEEYVKAHSAGNPNFKIDDWETNPNMLAIPALMSDRQKLIDYVKKGDAKELAKVLAQLEFLRREIRNQLETIPEKEAKAAKGRVNQKFINKHDLRKKDPSKMGYWEKIRYNQLMQQQREAEETKTK
jgi:hypothetical protein